MERIERKLRHLRRIEASYRADIRRALESSKANTADPVKAREKFEKVRARCERRIDRLVPKVKALSERREALKHRRAGKG
ncbi:MAG: hypothetical protein ACT4OI_04575 [Methanobacteriota archaeon]